jgi:hypothetical protein
MPILFGNGEWQAISDARQQLSLQSLPGGDSAVSCNTEDVVFGAKHSTAEALPEDCQHSRVAQVRKGCI